MMTPMSSDLVLAVRSSFSMDDPWRSPAETEPVRLRRSVDGGAPRLSTTVALSYDAEYLSILFSAADDHVVATYSAYGDPLYEEDVVEVFVAPEHPGEYFEVEVSPIGTMFDARIVSPHGTRHTMRVDRGWNAGAIVAVRKLVEPGGAITIDTLLRIPFRALETTTPADGDVWRANFFRIDRHPDRGDEYTAWRPTLRNPPDFHVPAAFGVIKFQSSHSRSGI